MKVVVTGATGFIGSRVRRLLAAQGHSVTAVVRAGDRPEEPGVFWVECDIADPGFVDVLL